MINEEPRGKATIGTFNGQARKKGLRRPVILQDE